MAAAIFQGNYIKLLKNALRLGGLSTAPSSPAAGDVYYDTVDQLLKFYNGTAWVIMGNGGIVSSWQPFGGSVTLTFNNLGTVTDNSQWRRVGDSIEIQGSTTVGTVGAAVPSIVLSGLSFDTAKFNYNQNTALGNYSATSNASLNMYSGQNGAIFTDGSTADTLFITSNTASAQFTKINANGLFDSNQIFSWHVTVPIDGWTSGNEDGLNGILQIVQAAKTDTFSSSSTSFTDITGLSVTLTPSSTLSKFLVLAQVSATHSSTSDAVLLTLVRNSTEIFKGDAASARPTQTSFFIPQNGYNIVPTPIMYLDSPSTTSAVTYKIQGRVKTGTFYVNRTVADTDDADGGRVVSSIIILEIV